MSCTVTWAGRTLMQLEKLDRPTQKKIVLAVSKLSDNPRPHGVKSLGGRPGEYRMRIGDYRVLYEINDGRLLVLVVAVAHGRDVYRGL